MLNATPFRTAGKVHNVRFSLVIVANSRSDCQCTDWPSHKRSCKSLAEGNWIDVCFCFPGYGPPEPNTHGDRPFLVRLMLPKFLSMSEGSSGDIFVCSRRRSLQHILQEPDPQNKERLMNVARSTANYRWAKRTGDWQLSICIDHVPEDGLIRMLREE